MEEMGSEINGGTGKGEGGGRKRKKIRRRMETSDDK